MMSSRTGLVGRPIGRRGSVLAGLAVLGLLAGTGCQVEYAGMTLPSGKYFHDDIQYFSTGPEFPFANEQAMAQRAKMTAAGIPVPPIPGGPNMTTGGAGIGPNGMPVAPAYAPGAVPRPGAAPEAENSMPGGASAPATPAPPSPATDPATPGPGGTVTPPPG
jgi:hypothetical protein